MKPSLPVITAVVLPMGALLALVGGIAWVTQQLPNYGGAKPKDVAVQGRPGANRGSDFVQFTHQRAVWDKEDEKYPREIEKGSAGFYVFPFHHPGTQAAELGLLLDSKCDCGHVHVGLMDDANEWERIKNLPKDQLGPDLTITPEPAWQLLIVDPNKGVEIPAAANGLVRVSWKGRKDPGAKLFLNFTLWVQPQGQADKRLFTKLDVPAVMAAPLQFGPLKLNLGAIGLGETRSGEFTVWSATRPRLDLDFPAKDNQPLEFTLIPQSADQVKALRATIKKELGITTHLQCAYTVKVRVQESKLNLGSFYKPLVVHLDGFTLDGDPPVVEGTVKGDIIVGGPDDKSKVHFPSFKARDGASKEISLWADAKITLAHHDQHPKTLQVTLTKDAEGATAAKTRWRLEVVVPPNTYFGAFAENCAVWLRLGESKRLLRIPVTGNAGS